MKSYLALAWKELKAQKITAILILVAVIMSTIMTTVIGQSIGILQSMRIQQAAGLNGNRYATFHQLGKEQAQKLHEDDRLYDVGDTIFIGSTPLGNSSLSLYLREYHDNALSMYPAIGNVKEGRLPEEAIEIGGCASISWIGRCNWRYRFSGFECFRYGWIAVRVRIFC